MTSSSFEKIISNRIPENAISYCVSIFNDNPFRFKITRNRKSKSGDYRFDKKNNNSTVTVNSGLNKYSFLITLIHEISHHMARIQYGNKIKPHGQEWKSEFKKLMVPLINPMVFPDDLLGLLARHFKNPKASTWSDSRLVMALRTFDDDGIDPDELHLDELAEGASFLFNDRKFIKINKRRTRILCKDQISGRKYLIPKQAVVKIG